MKMMDHSIEEPRDWAKTITQTVREPFVVLNKDLRLLAASSAFYHKFQITKEGSRGQIIYDLGNRQWDIPELRQLLEKMVFEQNNIEDVEIRHHFEAVGEMIMLINARRVVHEKDEPGLILLAIEDITKLSVTSQERKLRQNEKRQISEILEQLPAGICLLNQDGQILLGNAISRSILPAMMPSVDPERMHRWQTFDDRGQPIPPKQWPGARALRGETTIPGMEFVYIDDDGHEVWKLVSAVPFQGDQNSKEAIVIIQDITEIKRAEEQLQCLNDELEQIVENRSRELEHAQSQYLHAEKLSAIGQLAASIAHEFNNPLQGLKTILKGLKRRATMEEEDKELLDLAINENERLKKLIKSLQDFNRPSAGQKMEMDVHAALDSLLLLYKSDFKRKRISAVRKYAEGFPTIRAVPDQLKQVFLNLLNNATDACSEKGGVITIITCHDNQKAVIAIQDTGTGIENDMKNKIFEPFFTTKTEEKGTGLGLSICRDIIQHHQGEIRVESQPGKGSTFTILLPTI